jgi:hypothetical protein
MGKEEQQANLKTIPRKKHKYTTSLSIADPDPL